MSGLRAAICEEGEEEDEEAPVHDDVSSLQVSEINASDGVVPFHNIEPGDAEDVFGVLELGNSGDDEDECMYEDEYMYV